MGADPEGLDEVDDTNNVRAAGEGGMGRARGGYAGTLKTCVGQGRGVPLPFLPPPTLDIRRMRDQLNAGPREWFAVGFASAIGTGVKFYVCMRFSFM